MFKSLGSHTPPDQQLDLNPLAEGLASASLAALNAHTSASLAHQSLGDLVVWVEDLEFTLGHSQEQANRDFNSQREALIEVQKRASKIDEVAPQVEKITQLFPSTVAAAERRLHALQAAFFEDFKKTQGASLAALDSKIEANSAFAMEAHGSLGLRFDCKIEARCNDQAQMLNTVHQSMLEGIGKAKATAASADRIQWVFMIAMALGYLYDIAHRTGLLQGLFE